MVAAATTAARGSEECRTTMTKGSEQEINRGSASSSETLGNSSHAASQYDSNMDGRQVAQQNEQAKEANKI